MARQSIVFECFYKSNLEHLLPVFKQLRKHDAIETLFSVRDKDKEVVKYLIDEEGLEAKQILIGDEVLDRPCDLYLACDYGWQERYPVPTWPGPKIQMFHGLLNKTTFNENLLPYNTFLLYGPYSRRKFEEELADIHPGFRLLNSGYFKSDKVLAYSNKRSELLDEMGIDTSRPTVLLAPTHGPYASLFRYGLKLIEDLLELDINVVLKLHPYSTYLLRNTSLKWENLVKPYLENPKFTLAADSDSAKYLAIADLLISDASSVAFEFALLNRPIVFMDIPEFFKNEQSGSDNVEDWGRKIGEIVASTTELSQVIPQELNNPKNKELQRTEIVKELYYKPGESLINIERCIMQLLEELAES